jgi:suppressor for copper-sensitivity B
MGLLRRDRLGWVSPLLLAAGVAIAGSVAARAATPEPASSWFVTDQGKVRLIAASPTVGEEAMVRLGLEFRLAPGWKIYWRSPGDAGLPPTVDWTGSNNLADAAIAWPAPRRFSAYGLETIGYEDDVVLPITARLASAGQALSLRAKLQYLTCKDICIPYEGSLALDLAAGAATASAQAALIDRFLARVPGAETGTGLRLTDVTLIPGAQPTLELAIAAPQPLSAPDAFIEGPAGLGFGAPTVERRADGREGILVVPVGGDAAAIKALPKEALRVTLVDGAAAAEAEAVPSLGTAPRDLSRLAAMLGIALLGGLVLNVMPCVLPVLSIKLLAVSAHAGRTRGAIRRGFLATAAGIIASFLLLAAALLAVRSAGLAVGWGMQFQQPAFLVAMTALLAVFACNLGGLFEIRLPSWLGDAAASGSGGTGIAGDFFAGAVATLLATPCSAPFLGTAVGFALAGDGVDIGLIFLALGIGLAAPFLAVAAFPGAARRLPRPGHWMITLRRILAACLALTALWLLSVLAAQTSLAVAAAVALALVAAALVLRLAAHPAVRRSGVLAALLVAFLLPAVVPAPAITAAEDGTIWRKFDPAAIDGLVRDGKAVFVDVTADWCINCKVNERLVLGSDAVAQRLAGPEIVAMRADWTRPDAAIGAFLRGFGRFGIPFYAVFGPATPDGQGLPEILTQTAVLEALRKAGPDPLANRAAGGNGAVVARPASARDGG